MAASGLRPRSANARHDRFPAKGGVPATGHQTLAPDDFRSPGSKEPTQLLSHGRCGTSAELPPRRLRVVLSARLLGCRADARLNGLKGSRPAYGALWLRPIARRRLSRAAKTAGRATRDRGPRDSDVAARRHHHLHHLHVHCAVVHLAASHTGLSGYQVLGLERPADAQLHLGGGRRARCGLLVRGSAV